MIQKGSAARCLILSQLEVCVWSARLQHPLVAWIPAGKKSHVHAGRESCAIQHLPAGGNHCFCLELDGV